MKTRVIIVTLLIGGFSAVMGQEEFDDVYFSKKDRASVTPRKIDVARIEPSKTKVLTEATSVNQSYTKLNPSDNYTGRTINPDYQPGVSSAVSSSYFNPNYQPTGVNSALNQNQQYSASNNYNSNYGGYYSPYSNSGWGYPSYGYSGYPSYGYGGYNSGYGLSSCYSGMGGYGGYGMSYPYYYGSGYSSGIGFGVSLFNIGMGYGGGYGYGGGTTVVVVNNPDSHINRVYGRRQSRSSEFSNETVNHNYQGRSTNVSTNGQTPQGSRGGRVATTGTSTNTYYQRGWRQNPSLNPTTSSTTTTTTGGGRATSGSGWTHGNNSIWSNDSFNTGTTTGGSRSGGSFPSGGGFSGGSGGGRSSGGSFGGSGGGSHSSGGSRGRN